MSGGRAYGKKGNWGDCPYCCAPLDEPDLVDVGVGYVQCGPLHCGFCNSSQMGPETHETSHDYAEDGFTQKWKSRPRTAEELKVTEEEIKIGWYKGKEQISPYANRNPLTGELINHKRADFFYRNGLPTNKSEEFEKKNLAEPNNT